MSGQKETVLCVPEAVRLWMSIEHGFTQAFDRDVRELLAAGVGCWLDKERAEQDPAWKQLIPYCLIVRDGKLLSYRRGQACGESRLAGKLAFGIGGHVDKSRDEAPGDVVCPAYVRHGAAIRRGLGAELGEELEIGGAGLLIRPYFEGFLYDELTEVGRVHLGLVYLLELPKHAVVRSVDEAVTDLAWKQPVEYVSQFANSGETPEGWTRILLEAYMNQQILH